MFLIFAYTCMGNIMNIIKFDYVPVVDGPEGVEPLLSRRVPDVQVHRGVSKVSFLICDVADTKSDQ